MTLFLDNDAWWIEFLINDRMIAIISVENQTYIIYYKIFVYFITYRF